MNAKHRNGLRLAACLLFQRCCRLFQQRGVLRRHLIHFSNNNCDLFDTAALPTGASSFNRSIKAGLYALFSSIYFNIGRVLENC
ncbi:hypothetical protein [Enterobacter sp. R1(2018)]|uniref:hypothetical protein n=1 Tax=Enterobacter sp. R1(2018) TaxID=2447891 RepID=UPI001604493D